jgi:guanylate kinase
MSNKKRFVVLSGPACAGKGPLQDAVNRFYPGLLSAKPVLCHSRPPRVNIGEIHGKHFYFLPSAFIVSLKDNPNFAVSKVRSDWQAIDLLQIEDLLVGNDLVFAEVFHTFGGLLKKRISGKDFEFCSVFLLPKPTDTPDNEIVESMKEKLKNRGTEKDPKLSERANSAIIEIKDASQKYTHRILNPATEDDIEEWGELGTRDGKNGERKIESIDDLGEKAKWLVEIFVKIVNGELPPGDYQQ